MQIAISFTIWVIFDVFRYIILLTDVTRIKGNGSTVCTIWGKTRNIIRFTSEQTPTAYEYIYIYLLISIKNCIVRVKNIGHQSPLTK